MKRVMWTPSAHIRDTRAPINQTPLEVSMYSAMSPRWQRRLGRWLHRASLVLGLLTVVALVVAIPMNVAGERDWLGVFLNLVILVGVLSLGAAACRDWERV